MTDELSLPTRALRASPKGLFAGIPVVLLMLVALVAGCSQESANKSPSATPSEDEDRTAAPVTRRVIPETAKPQPESPAIATAPPPPEAAIIIPPGTQYVCVKDAAGQRQQTAIEFSPQVAQLCIKNPEMGPCQYERNACRRSGGRVFGGDGKEITLATEAEYDKKVMRVRLKSN